MSTTRWIKTPRVEIQWGQNSILHRPNSEESEYLKIIRYVSSEIRTSNFPPTMQMVAGLIRACYI